MKMNDAFPGQFLKAADIDKVLDLTIKDVKMQTVGEDSRLVAYFHEEDRGLVLNKTNLLPQGMQDAQVAGSRLLGAAEEKGKSYAAGISARSGEGVPELLALIDRVLPADPVERTRFRFPAGDGGTLHLLHEYTQVREIHYDEEICQVTPTAPQSLRWRVRRFVVQKVD